MGWIEVVKLMIDLMVQQNIIPDYNEEMVRAAKWGRIEVIKLMINLMVQRNIIPDYNLALKKAVHPFNYEMAPEIVKLMVDLGANNYYQVMKEAKSISEDHENTVELIEKYINYNKEVVESSG